LKPNTQLKIRIMDNKLVALKKENPYWRAFYASGFGYVIENALVLHPIEVLYLLDRERAVLIQENKQINFQQYLKYAFERIPSADLWRRYIVYRDIRSRGYHAKIRENKLTFLEIFERGKNPLQHDSFAFVMITEAAKELKLDELGDAIEEAKKHGKKLLVALLDELGDITYYSVDETLIEKTSIKIYRK